jgi:hypothetical protein
MNTITRIVFVLTLWLIMGLGFLAKAMEVRRKGLPFRDALSSPEGILFLLSVLVPMLIVIHNGADM